MMDLYNPLRARIGGLDIIASEFVGDPWTDWSGCRSPSRAKRRARRGHPQRTVTRYKANGTCYRTGNTVYMHPDDKRNLELQLRNRT